MSGAHRRSLVWGIVGCLLLAGCGSGRQARGAGAIVDVAEAARSAGFVLPPSAQAVGAYQMKGIDHLVAFAVRVPPAALADLLATAHFDTELQPGRRIFQEPVQGADLAQATLFAAGQDHEMIGGRNVTREVMVVTDDPAATVLHVWAFAA